MTEAITQGRFSLGRILVTPGVMDTVAPLDLITALGRHRAGDWGDIPPEDVRENDRSLERGGRVLSAYHSLAGRRFWIITESDRSVTTILLPQEY